VLTQIELSPTAVLVIFHPALELVLDTEHPALLAEAEPELELLEPPLVTRGDTADVVDAEVVGDELEVAILPPGSTVAEVDMVIFQGLRH